MLALFKYLLFISIVNADNDIQRSRPISDNGMRGILKYQGFKHGSYRPKKVLIMEVNNQIHEIEPRPPTPPLPTKTPIRPVDRVALKNDILYRICNWCYDWIEVIFFSNFLCLKF